jgi:hypothetical protein
MAKRTAERSPARPAKKTKASLGPGLHGATLELSSGESFRVRTPAGDRIVAVLGDQVERGLVEECLATGRMVVLVDTARGPTIVGALQTARSISLSLDGSLDVTARDIRLRADRSLVIEAGSAAVRADRAGLVRVEGEKMIIDVSSLVRFLSARVELP